MKISHPPTLRERIKRLPQELQDLIQDNLLTCQPGWRLFKHNRKSKQAGYKTLHDWDTSASALVLNKRLYTKYIIAAIRDSTLSFDSLETFCNWSVDMSTRIPCFRGLVKSAKEVRIVVGDYSKFREVLGRFQREHKFVTVLGRVLKKIRLFHAREGWLDYLGQKW